MRRFVQLLFTVFFFSAGQLCAQQPDTPTHMIRIYEDDDFINIWGQGTDNAYTNGTRLDYFYNLQHPSRFFIDKALPKAGAGSVNTYGWGIVQLMYTPDDLTSKAYNPHDYPYSGSLFASHSLFSYNPIKKYSFQSELILGVIGPAALAGPPCGSAHAGVRCGRTAASATKAAASRTANSHRSIACFIGWNGVKLSR